MKLKYCIISLFLCMVFAHSFAQNPNIIQVEKVTCNDSLVMHNITVGRISLTIDYPIATDSKLNDSIRCWIANNLNSYDTVFYNCNYKDNKTLLNYSIQRILSDFRLVSEDYDFDERMELGEYFGVVFSHDCEIVKQFENEKIVTYTSYAYLFYGGAHGAVEMNSATFQKKDGKILSWEMFDTTQTAQLSKLIKNDLKNNYFDAGHLTDREFVETYLYYYEDDSNKMDYELSLPMMNPIFEKDSVTFVYSQYEIGPYFIGMPTAKFSYMDIKQMLSPLGQEMLMGLTKKE